jgi:hypothetical protein
MFNSDEVKRGLWLHAKEQGRKNFILREVLKNVLLWAVIVPMVILSDRPHSFSVREIIPLAIFMLPIFLLGGYLSGRWKWKDFEKNSRSNLTHLKIG